MAVAAKALLTLTFWLETFYSTHFLAFATSSLEHKHRLRRENKPRMQSVNCRASGISYPVSTSSLPTTLLPRLRIQIGRSTLRSTDLPCGPGADPDPSATFFFVNFCRGFCNITQSSVDARSASAVVEAWKGGCTRLQRCCRRRDLDLGRRSPAPS